MEEDNELNMGIFANSNLELNIDSSNFESNDPLEDEQDKEITNEDVSLNNDAIEDVNPEDVDSEEEDLDEGSDEGSDNSSSNLYSSLATVVYEQGLLPSLNSDKINEIKNVNDLVEAFKIEKEVLAKQQLDDYISNLDISAIKEAKQNLINLESINEDSLRNDLNLAKNIIHQDYINQGLDETKVNRYLKRLVDLGEDAILEESFESLNSVKQHQLQQLENSKLESINNLKLEEESRIKLDNQIKNTIYENKDLIKGFKPTKVIQDKVYKSINDIVGKSPEGYFENKFMRERRENPIEFETRMYMFYELTDGFKNYNKLSTTAKSNAVKDLERIAQSSKIKDNGVPIWMQDSESYGGVGHELYIK